MQQHVPPTPHLPPPLVEVQQLGMPSANHEFLLAAVKDQATRRHCTQPTERQMRVRAPRADSYPRALVAGAQSCKPRLQIKREREREGTFSPDVDLLLRRVEQKSLGQHRADQRGVPIKSQPRLACHHCAEAQRVRLVLLTLLPFHGPVLPAARDEERVGTCQI